MQFLKRLREPIQRGEITTTIRIWQGPRVREGGRYRLLEGWVVIDRIRSISLTDISPEMAQACGFKGVVDLLKTAKHGLGQTVYWIDFHYESETGARG
ncbi:MAG: ASCH domain-containing protein [Acidobacteria bacterium]|nr:ASCH domain-containing protein [Acidobacteriota bacterium]